MKHFVYLGLITLAAASTACSNDDDQNYKPGEREDRINFGNAFVNNSVSQREAMTIENLKEFNVWGFVETPESYVFDGTRVYFAGNDWRYEGIEYWYPGKQYWFTAVAPLGEDSGWYLTKLTTPDSDKSYRGGGTVNFSNITVEGESDLIYAFAGPQSYDGEGTPAKVSFTFNHLLSQLRAEFTNRMTSTTTLKIEDVRFVNSPSTGSIDMTQENPVWELGAGNDYYSANTTLYADMIDSGDSNIAFGKTGASEGVFVIPTESSHTYQLGFTVLVFNGVTQLARYEHVVNLPATAFKMGRSYNLKAVITPENVNPDQQLQPIEFTVDQVNAWENDDDVELNLNKQQ